MPPPPKAGERRLALTELCGAPPHNACPTLPEYAATVRSQCGSEPALDPLGQPTLSTATCRPYTVVHSDHGVVAYWYYFDAGGVLVGALANAYEHRTITRYGTIPDCSVGAALPLCVLETSDAAPR